MWLRKPQESLAMQPNERGSPAIAGVCPSSIVGAGDYLSLLCHVVGQGRPPHHQHCPGRIAQIIQSIAHISTAPVSATRTSRQPAPWSISQLHSLLHIVNCKHKAFIQSTIHESQLGVDRYYYILYNTTTESETLTRPF